LIQNERQYQVTRRQLNRLQSALTEAMSASVPADLPPVIREGHLNSIQFLMQDLEAEIAEYDRLRRLGPPAASTTLTSLADLPAALVRARIAQNLSQRQLAERLGVTAQRVQQDESAGYARASLERLRRVADALGVKLEGETRVERVTDV
jgi:HTH-type transcriptional regulator/antitoxin HipB